MKRHFVCVGFGTFGDYVANSSEVLVRALAAKPPRDCAVTSVIFPCHIPSPKEDRARLLLEVCKPDATVGIIAFGMGSEKDGLCVERQARNRISNKKYCPQFGDVPIDLAFAYDHEIPVDLAPWSIPLWQTACTAQGISTRTSLDAGGFCCNHLMWQMATAKCRGLTLPPWIYLHIPCTAECIPEARYEAFLCSGKVFADIADLITATTLLIQGSAMMQTATAAAASTITTATTVVTMAPS